MKKKKKKRKRKQYSNNGPHVHYLDYGYYHTLPFYMIIICVKDMDARSNSPLQKKTKFFGDFIKLVLEFDSWYHAFVGFS